MVPPYICWKCGFNNKRAWTFRDELDWTEQTLWDGGPCRSCLSPNLTSLSMRFNEIRSSWVRGEKKDEATSEINEIIAVLEDGVSSGSSEAALALGEIHLELRNYDLAEKYLQPGSKNGNWSHSRLLIATYTRSGNLERAEKLVLEAIAEGRLQRDTYTYGFSLNIDMILDLAHGFYSKKDFIKAIHWYEMFPEDNYFSDRFGWKHLDILAKLYREVGRIEDAEKAERDSIREKEYINQVMEELQRERDEEAEYEEYVRSMKEIEAESPNNGLQSDS